MNEPPKFWIKLSRLISMFVAAGSVVYVGVKAVEWIIEYVKTMM